MTVDEILNGKCLCGQVTVEATPVHKQFDACHCAMCRQWSAGPFMAIPCGDTAKIRGEGVKSYRSSEWAERVFCENCGTNIAWRLHDGTSCHIAAHLFKQSETYPFKMQVFIDEKPDNYSFEQQTETMTGPEIFAMFANEVGANHNG